MWPNCDGQVTVWTLEALGVQQTEGACFARQLDGAISAQQRMRTNFGLCWNPDNRVQLNSTLIFISCCENICLGRSRLMCVYLSVGRP